MLGTAMNLLFKTSASLKGISSNLTVGTVNKIWTFTNQSENCL